MNKQPLFSFDLDSQVMSWYYYNQSNELNKVNRLELLHQLFKWCYYNNINSLNKLKQTNYYKSGLQPVLNWLISIFGEKGIDQEIKSNIHF